MAQIWWLHRRSGTESLGRSQHKHVYSYFKLRIILISPLAVAMLLIIFDFVVELRVMGDCICVFKNALPRAAADKSIVWRSTEPLVYSTFLLLFVGKFSQLCQSFLLPTYWNKYMVMVKSTNRVHPHLFGSKPSGNDRHESHSFQTRCNI